jgi:hypothetical protein
MLLLAALALAGCWRGRLLVCAEPAFLASMGEPASVEVSLAARSLLRGYWPSFLRPGPQENPRVKLSAALATGHFAAAVVGPLLSLEAAGYTQGFPKVRFILVGGNPVDARANVVVLDFDRVEAFRLAGEAARSSLAGGESRARVGVLSAIAAADQDEEVRAFLEGAGGNEGGSAERGEQAIVRTVEQPLDEQKIRAAVAELRRGGVEIFLPRIPGFEAVCLEAIRDNGGSAVMSDWAVSGAFSRQVFLSVEEESVAGIVLCLGRAGRAGGVLEGPVGIVCGTARSISREQKKRLGCR